MQISLAIALLSTVILQGQTTSAPPSQTPPAQRPNPCNAPEYRQFDFWIGTWDVKGPNGQTLGVNVIEPITGNCGLHEHWTGAAGGGGRSLNTYQRSDGKWHQVWVGSDGAGMLLLSGGAKEGAMVMEGTTPGQNRTTVLNRISWTPQPGGGLRQLWQTSNDNGKTWTATFDGYYTKRAK
jgi:hypothetical protein